MKKKYPISNEFFPMNHFTTPTSLPMIKIINSILRPPVFLWTDPQLDIEQVSISGYQGDMIDVLIMTPKNIKEPAPCIVDFHGGGFIFEAFMSHYRIATMYAKYGRCKVVFVNYRTVPKYPLPYPQEDCFATYKWLCDNAEELGVDPTRIGVLGDSAGGMLVASTCMLARDRGLKYLPCFQLLIYPWLDDRYITESARKYTDTPMWNSTLGDKLKPLLNIDPDKLPLVMHSPIEVDNYNDLPPAYIEVAEFDCLHDEGIIYGEKLKETGKEVHIYEVKNAMHAFDTRVGAPTSIKMIKNRIRYIRSMV